MKDATLQFVSRAHKAALNTACWPSALRALEHLLGGTAVALRLQFPQSKRTRILGASQFQSGVITRHASKLGDGRFNPFIPKIITSPVGTPVLRKSVLSDAGYLRSDLYQQFYRPQKLFHAFEIAVERWDRSVAVLNFARPRRRPEFEGQDFEKLETVMPHLRHALQLSRRVADLQAERDLSYETLDRLDVAVLAVTTDGRPLFLNYAAKRLVEQKDGLLLGRFGICGETSRETLRLRQLIHRVAAAKCGDTLAAFEAVSLNRRSREGALSVLAVRKKQTDSITGTFYHLTDDDGPLVLLFVCDPARVSTCPIHALMDLYGLTRAEARLASAMAAGKSVGDAARDFGIKTGTARIELSNIYSKTETHRQAELVRLLLSTAILSGEETR